MQNPNILFNAASYAGLSEVKGPGSNVEILDAIHVLFPDWKDDSTIAWCSCFTHLVAENVCVENPKRNGIKNPGLARSWLAVGEPVDNPMPGDIAVFWRGSPTSNQGHVAFYLNSVGPTIYVFGGNQSDSVTKSGYAAKRLLGYRRLRALDQV